MTPLHYPTPTAAHLTGIGRIRIIEKTEYSFCFQPRRPMASIKPPQQERSRRSMNEALDATLELLEERSFDELSIARILDRAGQSAGQFYARFSGKEALFLELCRRFENRVRDRVAGELADWRHLERRERMRRLVELIAALNIENRPLLRSLFLRLWRDPGGHRRMAREIASESFDALMLRELRRGDEAEGSAGIDEPAARLVLEVVAATCRHELLFGSLYDAAIGDQRLQELVDLLTRLVIDELGAGERR